MIEVRNLSKRYGTTVAVDDLSFDVRPGVVTGFLGPNGAGKSTTMRMIMGLDHPTAGTATVGGRRYQDLRAPLHEVGALLSAQAVHPGRSARAHLRWIARAGGVAPGRVDEVLGSVGLTDVGDRRVGGFSLGMLQRLGIATALLGDPAILLLDEPANGLDPEGILWVRTLMKDLAAEGRTVFVSSHQMSEMQQTADHLVVIGQGRFIADMAIDDLTQRVSDPRVRVVSPQAGALAPLLTAAGATTVVGSHDAPASGTDRLPTSGRRPPPDQRHRPPADNGTDGLLVSGLDAARIGDVAAAHGIALHELTPLRPTLEAAFLELTRDSVAHRATGHPPAAEAVARELTTEGT